jgi:hypothetical protein
MDAGCVLPFEKGAGKRPVRAGPEHTPSGVRVTNDFREYFAPKNAATADSFARAENFIEKPRASALGVAPLVSITVSIFTKLHLFHAAAGRVP